MGRTHDEMQMGIYKFKRSENIWGQSYRAQMGIVFSCQLQALENLVLILLYKQTNNFIGQVIDTLILMTNQIIGHI